MMRVYTKPRHQRAGFKTITLDTFDGDLQSTYVAEQTSDYRIQNNSAVGYLLYVGVNGPPDFNKEAAYFSPTLPINLSWPLPDATTQVLYVVPRYRDSFGCISQNSNPKIITLTPTGRLKVALPTPESVGAYPRANGNILVMGQYPSFSIDEDAADKVTIWVSASEIDLNSAYTSRQNLTGSPWSILYGSYSPGTYNVAVRYYRSTDGAQSPVVMTTVTFPTIPDMLTPVFTENIT